MMIRARIRYTWYEAATFASTQVNATRPPRHDGMRREGRLGRRLMRAAHRKKTSR